MAQSHPLTQLFTELAVNYYSPIIDSLICHFLEIDHKIPTNISPKMSFLKEAWHSMALKLRCCRIKHPRYVRNRMPFQNIFTCAVDTYFLIHADKSEPFSMVVIWTIISTRKEYLKESCSQITPQHIHTILQVLQG